MITAEEINKKIKAFSKSKKGKEKLSGEIKSIGKSSGKSVEYRKVLSELIEEIKLGAPEGIRYLMEEENLVQSVSKPEALSGATSGFSIKVVFNEENLKRPSMEEYKYGRINVVKTFINGWDFEPEKRFVGKWTTHEGNEISGVVTKSKREGKDFIQEGINRFMAAHKDEYGIISCTILDDEYIKG